MGKEDGEMLARDGRTEMGGGKRTERILERDAWEEGLIWVGKEDGEILARDVWREGREWVGKRGRREVGEAVSYFRQKRAAFGRRHGYC